MKSWLDVLDASYERSWGRELERERALFQGLDGWSRGLTRYYTPTGQRSSRTLRAVSRRGAPKRR